jgi:hypothetical protein
MDELKNFEIIQTYTPYSGLLSIYFIESHLISEDKSIEISLDSKDSSISNLIKIHQEEFKSYFINIYKFNLNPSLVDRKNIKYTHINKMIEIKIILTQNKCIFKSINLVDLENDTFLGNLKFSEYKWYLGMKYQPPINALLTDLEIINYYISTLITKENKHKSDLCYGALINYGINLLNNGSKYDFNLFILIYINAYYNEKENMIQKILDTFDIDKIIINNNSSLSYLDELENIYRNQYYHIEKLENKSVIYVIKFYTIYIYFLNILNQKEKLSNFLYELIDNNKYDKLILPKLFLSKYFSFYKTLIIPDDIKIKLINNFINVSSSYNDILNSFSLISEFTNKNFIEILTCIYNNYDKIYKICYEQKRQIILKEYYYQKITDKDKLSTIKNCLDFIITKKTELNYDPIKIDISAYIYFIHNYYDKEFLYFIENKLLDNFIKFEDIEDALLFSSQLRNKQFIPLLETIKKKIKIICKICKQSGEIIDINKYIQKSEKDDLIQIKDLISFIVENELEESYLFIDFNVKIWLSYTITDNLDDLIIIGNIISICKNIDNDIDEENIQLGDKIHNLGLELIRQGKLKGDKLTEFLGGDVAFYTDKKIKNLENENNQLKLKLNNIEGQVNNIRNDLGNLTVDVKTLSKSHNRLTDKVNYLEKNINNIKKDVNSLEIQVNIKNNY